MIQKYIITLSNKATISIDEDEVPLVVEAIKSGSFGRVRQGIFNPSYFVSLTPDVERYNRYIEENRYRGPNQPEKKGELLPLKDIFQKVLPPGKVPKLK